MTTEKYIYLPLEHRHIRILRAYRDDASGLRCEFRHVSLDDLTVPYSALSYTWGDPAEVSRIWCDDGRFLNLTASAADILTHDFVLENKGTYFWIDLLCINQQDLQEKAHQVRLMGEIFASAGQVITWLGRASEDSDLAMDFILTIYRGIRNLVVTQVPVTKASLCETELCEHPSPRWTAIRKLLQRPWFARMWVVQEIVMAPENIILVCGELAVKWDIFATALTLVHANHLSSLLGPTEYESGIEVRAPDGLFNIETIYGLRIKKQKRSLQVTLTDCASFNATDPRDQIYAVMGMVNDANDAMLDPDYQASVREVYISWSRYMLTTNTSLQVLHLAGIGLPRLIADLPSWVSDWSAHKKDTVLGNIADTASYRASGSASSCVQTSTNPNSITVRAIVLDTISKCILQPDIELSWRSDDAEVKDYRKSLLDWIDELKSLLHSSHYYHNPDKNVLWRTLIGNVKGMGYPASDEYGDFFDAWQSINKDIAKHGNASQCTREAAEQAQEFNSSLNAMGKRVALGTRNGLLGLGPRATQSGDLVCILLGAHTPFLIRENPAVEGQEHAYQLVGECYMHGLMNGEGLGMGMEQDLVLM